MSSQHMFLRHEECFTRPESRHIAFDNIIQVIFLQIYTPCSNWRYMQTYKDGHLLPTCSHLTKSISLLPCVLHVVQYTNYTSSFIVENTPLCSMTQGCLGLY